MAGDKCRNVALSEVESFIRRIKGLIEGIDLGSLINKSGLNPYMVAALGVSSMEDVVRLYVYRRLETSLSTSFGNFVETLLLRLLGGKRVRELDPRCRSRTLEKPWICWWDIVLQGRRTIDGKTYEGVVISVKSSPLDLSKEVVEDFIRRAREAESKNYRPYMVLAYGRELFPLAEPIFKREGMKIENYILIGRELFKEFLGDPSCYDRIIDGLASAHSSINVFELAEEKVRQLSNELKRHYPDVLSLLKDIS